VTRTCTSLLHRIVMWAAGVVLVVSVVAWVTSLANIGCIQGDGVGAWLHRGELHLNNLAAHAPFEMERGWHVEGLAWPRWRWPVGEHVLGFYDEVRPPGIWRVQIPLWVAITLAAVAFTPAYFAGYKGRRWRATRHCTTCRYDLTGLTGPCPECGKERQP